MTLEFIILIGFITAIYLLVKITKSNAAVAARLKIIDIKQNYIEILTGRLFQEVCKKELEKDGEDDFLNKWWKFKDDAYSTAAGEIKMGEIDRLVKFADENDMTFGINSTDELPEEEKST